MPPDDIVRRVRSRQELLIELEHDALLDIIIWSRWPVRKSASKEELAREIARIDQTNYDSLPKRGLVALARLRGISAHESDNAEDVIRRLRKADGPWSRLRRKRRSVVASFVSKLVDRPDNVDTSDYQFLPEDRTDAASARESLKNQIEEHGLVGGLANRIRGAADDYVRIKLDEIEHRIDSKLDEIDRRLGEWRDREVANRLKILRITLIFTVVVAVLSLGYNVIKKNVDVESPAKTEQSTVSPSPSPSPLP